MHGPIPDRTRRASALAALVLLTTSSLAQGGTPITRVTGTYSYTSISGPKAVSVDAHLTDPVKGSWHFTNWTRVSNGEDR